MSAKRSSRREWLTAIGAALGAVLLGGMAAAEGSTACAEPPLSTASPRLAGSFQYAPVESTVAVGPQRVFVFDYAGRVASISDQGHIPRGRPVW